MSDFETVVITGANRGLGLEWARQLSPRCDRIIATCRDPESADELNALAQAGPVEVVRMDVRSGSDINQLKSLLAGSPLDMLINNSGVIGPADAEHSTDLDAWREVLEVNTLAPIHIAQTLATAVASSSRKLVVNITSKMGSIEDNSSGGRIIYRSSKAALNAATRSYAIDHAGEGMITLLLHPGWVRTDMGGPSGLIDVDTSVRGMLAFVDGANSSHNGGFYNYDGSPIPW